MKNSIEQISELLNSDIDFDLNDMLRLVYHCYNINQNHPYISILQSYCFKLTQKGLTDSDQKSIRKILEHFILFPKPSTE